LISGPYVNSWTFGHPLHYPAKTYRRLAVTGILVNKVPAEFNTGGFFKGKGVHTKLTGCAVSRFLHVPVDRWWEVQTIKQTDRWMDGKMDGTTQQRTLRYFTQEVI
jgi:hypothetical protein